ncbi:HNH endonuclease [Methylobacterium oxalidis]|uniref:HNH endonuclease n=1 Tax=Methylobacterium oxalidis TaxID=944322 RepID=UPI003315D222
MPLITPDDIGTTPRSCLSPRRRLQAWERTNGKCVVCGERIDGARERWIVEHIRALELGGADELDNMGPAHEACGREKTRDDHARTARAKRQKLRHIGAAAPEHPLPGSRTSPLKRKLNGTVVPREVRLVGLTAKFTRQRIDGAPDDVKHGLVDRVPLAGRAEITSEWLDSNKNGTNKAVLTPNIIPSPTNSNLASVLAARAPHELLPALPAHLAFLFEDRPLLPGEDPAQYNAVLASIVQQVKPRDVVETLWVKDLVGLVWEAKRLRLWRQRIVDQARLQAAEALIKPVLEAQDKSAFPVISEIERKARDLALNWLNGKAAEAATVETLLQVRGLTTADVIAKAFELRMPDLERVDRMLTNADSRRDVLLRKIECNRASLGQSLRAESDDIIDVEPSTPGAQRVAPLSN